ncbi:MAG: divalent-cation tolerance protein CutA [Candidatus Diapherotrites archaeon]|uniref:Divalent-cation tolerance protein CutA n=1 Tax=Candidatus Iainarchaeum sp. TaxID=3101447 RepID=A0A938YX83_9ARCH|nr:divalent-cation tolerance protein CutA [Candidatus Diapherotrites archaeon]
MPAIGFVTCRDATGSRKIAQVLLEKRLVACANIIPKIESQYWWKGSLSKAAEALLLIKTRKELREKAMAEIKKLHSYELPIIEFSDSVVSKGAEEWIKKETK